MKEKNLRYSGPIPPQPGDEPGRSAFNLSLRALKCSTGCPLGTFAGRGRPLGGYLAATWARTAASSMLARPWLVTLDMALEIWPAAIRLTTSLLLLFWSSSISAKFGRLLLLLSLSAFWADLSFSQSSTTVPQSPLVKELNLLATSFLPALPPLLGLLSRA